MKQFAALFACLLIPLTLLSSQPDIESAFKRCEAIERDIEKIRELKFLNPVKVEVQSKEDFIRYLEAEIEKQYGDEGMINNYVDALVLLGALQEKVDFNQTLKEMMTSQAAAHYDPKKKIYYLLASDMPDQVLDIISSHELCHALQDQHFDLSKLIMDPKISRENADAAMARQCLAEGDATIVMTWWGMASQMGSANPAQMSTSVSMGIRLQASMDFDMILKLLENGIASDASLRSMAGSIEDLKKFPRFFMESLYMAYLQGALAVDHVRTKGGWEAVNELFRNPPSSTEQILHPEKLLGRRDEPVDVRLPSLLSNPPEGWEVKETNVLGELGIRILLSIWQDKNAAKPANIKSAAAGWGGDRYYYLKNSLNEELLVWKSVWDTEKDAEEFEAALKSSLQTRWPELKNSPAPWQTKDKRNISVQRNGANILMLNTPPSINLNTIIKP